MEKETFELIYKEVVDSLKRKELGTALVSLKSLADVTEDVRCNNALAEVRDSYKMMLDYYERGFEDPQRENLYQQFLRRCNEISDVIYRSFLVKEGTSHYASVWNVLNKVSSVQSLPDFLEHNGDYRELFEIAWTAPQWQKSDYEAAHGLMESHQWGIFEKCLLVSGVTLGAVEVFDVFRLKFLLDVSLNPVVSLRVRALVGVILVYQKFSERCAQYPELNSQLRLMADVPGFVTMLQSLQIQFFLSLETKEIEKQLREEILPEVMKHSKKFPMDKSFGLDELKGTLQGDLDVNPEWLNNEKVKELEEKFKHLSQLHMKGADVYMGSFKMIAQKYPFFNVAANWFCPFTFDHQGLRKGLKDNKFLTALFKMGQLCETDMYSMCLLMQDMPLGQMEALKQNFPSEMMDHEQEKTAFQETEDETAQTIRSYVQGIYRYFTLFKYRNVGDNPFARNLLLMDFAPFNEIMSGMDTMQTLADFCFKEKSYLYALHFYSLLPAKAENYQKIGFCHQSVRNYQLAAEAYERANLMKSDSAWTIRQLANCYRLMSNYEKAVQYYEEALTYTPDDISLLLRLGECYLQTQKYDKAFEKLYKADYLSEDSDIAIRALAWCSLLTGKYEQACDYYQKILVLHGSAEDFFNAGHAEWLRGNLSLAIKCYRKKMEIEKKSMVGYDFFGRDADMLIEKGKSVMELHLMVDSLNQLFA